MQLGPAAQNNSPVMKRAKYHKKTGYNREFRQHFSIAWPFKGIMISPTVNLADIGVKLFETAGHFVSLLIATSKELIVKITWI